MGHHDTAGQERDDTGLFGKLTHNIGQVCEAENYHRLKNGVLGERSESLEDPRARQPKNDSDEQ